MSLPTVDSNLPRVVASGSGELTRTEADDIYIAQTDATGYDDILTATDAAATYVAQADVALCQAQRATLAFGDTTAKDLFTLPSGAIILGFIVNVTEAFDGDSSNVIDIGDGTTADRFVAGYDVSSGNTGIALAASADEAALSADTPVKGVYTAGGGTPSAGAVTVTALYLVPAA